MAAPPSSITMKKPEDNLRYRRKMFSDRQQQYPSFSSSVLERIFNSIDEGCDRTTEPEASTFYRDTAEASRKKTLQEALHLERNSMEKTASNLQRTQIYEDHHHDFDHDAPCFSTSSCSSESSSGQFSSSESESVIGDKTRASCFVPLRLKPVRTKAPEQSKKTERALFQEKSSPKLSNESGGNGVLRSKVLNLFDQLRKSKQPISPGGRLINFINSLFSSSASTTKSDRTIRKKTGDIRSHDGEVNREREMHSSQSSTCSSASSTFSRSCLSRHSPQKREQIGNGAQRSVRFHPVSVIIDGDCRPCEHKCLYPEGGGRGGGGGGGDSSGLLPVLVPKAWMIRRTQSRRADQDHPTSWPLRESYDDNGDVMYLCLDSDNLWEGRDEPSCGP
ncbi:hypothetical protein CRG98_021308 [Punica granatum]|uniref:Protein BIG GRAIN 1-like A n=1 Tax=Punica granatum TaxID=22663 RepID=A0A2I0JPT4_PUNGR|nr:hypothetical protein CRG98_021308 [Punica granatum]